MATSGSIDFTNTRDEIITVALRKLGVLSYGETPASDQIADASGELNRMVKAWQADGIHLWAYSEGVLFFESGKEKYNLGATGDRAANVNNFVQTELAADVALGASTITVDSITDISDTDVIGVVQDDNTIHWTTVNGTPSGTTVTLTDVTTVAAATDNHVYVYSSLIERPLRITDARLRQNGDIDTTITKISRDSYFKIANKTNTGAIPNQFYYDPQLTNGIIRIWSTPDDVQATMRFTFQRSIEDFDNINDNPDFPQEWLQALIYNLADEMIVEYGVIGERAVKIEGKATYWLNKALDYDVEDVPIQFVPTDESIEGYD
jgi:hypothetical protein